MTTAGAEVLPPWKQEEYTATAEAQMKETRVSTSTTQIRTEERWEGRYGVQEQVTISGAAAGEVAAADREVKSIFGKSIGFALCVESPFLNRSANGIQEAVCENVCVSALERFLLPIFKSFFAPFCLCACFVFLLNVCKT